MLVSSYLGWAPYFLFSSHMFCLFSIKISTSLSCGGSWYRSCLILCFSPGLLTYGTLSSGREAKYIWTWRWRHVKWNFLKSPADWALQEETKDEEFFLFLLFSWRISVENDCTHSNAPFFFFVTLPAKHVNPSAVTGARLLNLST